MAVNKGTVRATRAIKRLEPEHLEIQYEKGEPIVKPRTIRSVGNYIGEPPGSGATPISASRLILFFSGGLDAFGRGPSPGIPLHS